MNILTDYIRIFIDLAYIVQLICVAILIVTALQPHIKSLSQLPEFIVETILLMFTSAIINFLFYRVSQSFPILKGAGIWCTPLITIICFAAIICPFEKSLKIMTSAVVYSLTMVVTQIGDTYGMLLSMYITNFNILYVKIAASLFLLIAAVFFDKTRMSAFKVSPYTVRLTLSIAIPSAAAVIVYDMCRLHIMPINDSKQNMPVYILMSIILILLFIIDAVTYRMAWQICREQNEILELQVEKQLNSSTKQLLTIADHNLLELHKIRHDIRNQYAYMQILLNNEQYDDLRNYYYELLGSFAEPLVSTVDCGNRVLDAIFNMENTTAHRVGATLDLKLAVPPTLPFKEVDMCKLLTNLVDNAIEAVSSEKCDDKTIYITMKPQQDYMFIQVRNQTKKSPKYLENGLRTTKANKETHGKGHAIIQSVVDKYNGHILYHIKDGMFNVEILMDMYQKKEQP